MKKIFILLFLFTLLACQDQPISFSDFDFQAVYFPVQLPVRTLSLGEDRLDNSLDKQYIFDIGVTIGGMFENKRDWTVDYVLDSELTNNVFTNTLEEILPLPSQYYTMSPLNTVIIPKGSFNGLIRVQLTSDFFDDPISLTGRYVVPLRLTNTSADSILMGLPSIPNPDIRVKADWESGMSPKNWTLYGVKYVNAYHGTYFHRGRDIRVSKDTGEAVDTVVFRNQFEHREKDPVITLKTISRLSVVSNGVGNLTGGGNSMILTFTKELGESGSVTISANEDADYEVTGSGQYFDKASSKEQWTKLTWQGMYLNYTYDDGTLIHNIVDTLVFRDRGIKWEENKIIIDTP